MPDYQKLYTNLFNHISDVIAELQYAQQEAEELYVTTSEHGEEADE